MSLPQHIIDFFKKRKRRLEEIEHESSPQITKQPRLNDEQHGAGPSHHDLQKKNIVEKAHTTKPFPQPEIVYSDDHFTMKIVSSVHKQEKKFKLRLEIAAKYCFLQELYIINQLYYLLLIDTLTKN